MIFCLLLLKNKGGQNGGNEVFVISYASLGVNHPPQFLFLNQKE